MGTGTGTGTETWEERVARERREEREGARAIMSCIAEGADAVLSTKLGGAWSVTVRDKYRQTPDYYWDGGYEVTVAGVGNRRFTVRRVQGDDRMVEVCQDLPDGVEHRHLQERLPRARFAPSRGPVGLAGAVKRIISESERVIEEAEEAAIRERGYRCRQTANVQRIAEVLGASRPKDGATTVYAYGRLGSVEVEVYEDTARVKLSSVPIDELVSLFSRVNP